MTGSTTVSDLTAQIRGRARELVALMTAMSIMSYVDRTILSIASPAIIREFRLSETQMGTVFSAFILSYSVLMAPGGRLADRFGPRLVLGWVAITGAVFTALTAVVGWFGASGWLSVLPGLLAVRFIFGACASPLYPTIGRLTANWIHPAARARVQSVIIAGAPLGGAIAPMVFAWLITRWGWKVSFLFAAAATGLLAFVWLARVWDSPSARRQSAAAAARSAPAGSWRRLLTNRDIQFLTLGYFTLNYFEYIFFYWIYYYFGVIRGAGTEQSAIYTTALLLAMMVITPLGGWATDRLGLRIGARLSRRRVSVTGMVLSAALLYLGTGIEAPVLMVAFMSLALGFAASSEGPFWAALLEAGGKDAGAAGGIMNGVGNVGGLIAPVLTPYIAGKLGWAWSLHVASVIILIGAASWFFVGTRATEAAEA